MGRPVTTMGTDIGDVMHFAESKLMEQEAWIDALVERLDRVEARLDSLDPPRRDALEEPCDARN